MLRVEAQVTDVSPLGLSLTVAEDAPDLLNSNVIVATDTMIMYAQIVRRVPRKEGGWQLGVNARRFTPEIVQYLFTSISGQDVSEMSEYSK